MRLWLLCCILLFAATQGYEWLVHQVNFVVPPVPWPLAVIGGMALAIASNRQQLDAIAPTELSSPTPLSATERPAITPVVPADPQPPIGVADDAQSAAEPVATTPQAAAPAAAVSQQQPSAPPATAQQANATSAQPAAIAPPSGHRGSPLRSRPAKPSISFEIPRKRKYRS